MKYLMNMSTNKEPTMSSKQIADMVEKRHDNVKRTMKILKIKELYRLLKLRNRLLAVVSHLPLTM